MKPESFCELCNEPLIPGEPISPTSFNGKPVHFECGLRSVIGGANHILKLCSCCGGDQPPDPPGLSARDAARLAYSVWRQRT